MSAIPDSTTLSAYIEAMKKNSFTQNWDVVVTYDQQKINDLLAQRYQERDHGMVTDITLHLDADSPYGSYQQWYHFLLGPPLIQFNSTTESPTCSLKTVITGGKIWAILADGSKAQEEDLPADAYSITISNIHLGSVTGTVEDLEDPAKVNTIAPSDSVVNFPDDNTHSSHIVIDMPTSTQLVLNVAHPTIPNPPFAMKDQMLVTTLMEFFTSNIRAINYTLAIVNNAKPTTGTTDLVPKTLRFATFGLSDSRSYLSMFIQTQSSDKQGNTDALQSLWIAAWHTATVPPVPTDESASIIINNSFFVSAFVKPTLEKYKATYEVKLGEDKDGGICVQGTWPKLTRPRTDWNTSRPAGWAEAFKNIQIPEVKYNPNEGGSPLQITFMQSNGTDQPATVSVNWSYSYRNDWSGTLFWLVPAPRLGVVEKTRNEYGNFKSTYSISSSHALTTLNDESFTINIGLKKSDWTVSTEVDNTAQDRGFWGAILEALGTTVKDRYTVPTFVQEHAIDQIDFSLDFGTLRFFCLTNVLLPGKKVIEVNIQSGVRVPRDVVVVGNVVKSLSTTA